MSERSRLPCLKPHAAHTAARRSLAGMKARTVSMMTAFAAATKAIVVLSAMPSSLPHRSA